MRERKSEKLREIVATRMREKEGGRMSEKRETERDRQIDVISQDHVCTEPLSTVFSKLPGLLCSSVWFFPGFCFLRPDSHSIRSKIHVHLELCPTEVLLQVASWQIKFKAFTIYDLGCRCGALFRDESFHYTSCHYKEPFLLWGPQLLGKEMQIFGRLPRWRKIKRIAPI